MPLVLPYTDRVFIWKSFSSLQLVPLDVTLVFNLKPTTRITISVIPTSAARSTPIGHSTVPVRVSIGHVVSR